MKKILLGCLLALFMAFGFYKIPVVSAQSSGDGLDQKTQQYIDNINELKDTQNADKPNNQVKLDDKGPSVWTFVFYGFLSGATYAFWRWVKKLKNGG